MNTFEHMDDEERKLIDDLVRHDQALSDDERRTERERERLLRYKGRLERMQKLLSLSAPSPILGGEAFLLFRTAWALWEADMEREFGNWMRDIFRKESARCTMCAADLPLPYSDEDLCPKCIERCKQLVKDG